MRGRPQAALPEAPPRGAGFVAGWRRLSLRAASLRPGLCWGWEEAGPDWGLTAVAAAAVSRLL